MKKLLKGIFICLFAIFLMSHNAFAAEVVNDQVSLYATVQYINFTCGTTSSGGVWMQNNNSCHLSQRAQVDSFSFQPTTTMTLDSGAYFIEVYLRISNNATTDAPVWYGAGNGSNMQFVSEEQVSSTTANSITYRTYRLLYRYTGSNTITADFNRDRISIGTPGGMFGAESYKVISIVFWKTNTSDTASVIQAINAQNQYLQDISQNLYIADGHLDAIEDYLEFIKDNIDDLKDSIDDQNQQEQDSLDNIENQSPEDISDSGETENQATTNLIGLFQSFITALSGITQANNCNITLAFPSYAGGNIVVNVCQNKDKGGNIVAVFSSLTLIIFYIPLALKLLSMIYNEIRSFTNG